MHKNESPNVTAKSAGEREKERREEREREKETPLREREARESAHADTRKKETFPPLPKSPT
jgi:hypothetical protein